MGSNVIAETAWTLEPPNKQGTYWHWNGDRDSAPVPMFVMWSSTTGKCFVSMGQLGITHAIDCDQYGGWWQTLHDPPMPTYEQEEREQRRFLDHCPHPNTRMEIDPDEPQVGPSIEFCDRCHQSRKHYETGQTSWRTVEPPDDDDGPVADEQLDDYDTRFDG